MSEKKDVWEIISFVEVKKTVAFYGPVTAEEAETAYMEGSYADILDEVEVGDEEFEVVE